MAIIIKEQKKKKSSINIAVILMVLAILGGGGYLVYYLLLMPVSDAVASEDTGSGYQSASAITSIRLDIDSIKETGGWDSLTEDVVPSITLEPPIVRKDNPFR